RQSSAWLPEPPVETPPMKGDRLRGRLAVATSEHSSFLSVLFPCASTQNRKASLDHLIRPRQQRGWDREAERFGGLEVDDQLELRRLLDGQVGRFCTFEDLVDLDRRAAPGLIDAVAVVHQPAGLGKPGLRRQYRQAVRKGQLGQTSMQRLEQGTLDRNGRPAP